MDVVKTKEEVLGNSHAINNHDNDKNIKSKYIE